MLPLFFPDENLSLSVKSDGEYLFRILWNSTFYFKIFWTFFSEEFNENLKKTSYMSNVIICVFYAFSKFLFFHVWQQIMPTNKTAWAY